jgi:hypothetical protein
MLEWLRTIVIPVFVPRNLHVYPELPRSKANLEAHGRVLESRRKDIIAATEQLLRVTSDCEPEEWRRPYVQLIELLRAERDEDVIKLAQDARLEHPYFRDMSIPNWEVSKRLAEVVGRALSNYSNHLHWRRGYVKAQIATIDPAIDEHGTRVEFAAKQAELSARAPAERHDPIEDDPKYKPILEAAERDTEQELADCPRVMGFCHRYWGTKKRILKEKYGVEWKTPAELNLNIIFD